MADKRAYFKLDVGYLSNPKIAALLDEHPRAILLHLECIAYATQHLTDGLVPMRLAMRLACSEQCDLDLLLQSGLLIQRDSVNVEVRDYLEHQRSAAEVKAAADKGRRAAEARWEDAQRNASSNAPSMPDALPNPMPREKERKREELPAIDTKFAEFWAAYPKRVGKGQAVAAWKKAVKKESAEAIIAAASVYAASVKGKDQQFTANPSTWLNGERWADETASASAGPDMNEWFLLK